MATTSDPKAKADNSGDPANAEAAKAHANDDSTVFAKADPTTVDRDKNDDSYDAVAEVNRLRQQVIDAPAPGSDPDSRRRLGKTFAAAGEDVPGHLKTGNDYPYDTDSDRLKDAGMPDRDNDGNPNPHADDNATDDDNKGTAAAKRAAAGASRTTVQGRSATPTTKAAE